jgi:hypothetical protein
MRQLSYGIDCPEDLYEKLKHDASKLTATPHPHDVFNFVVTSSVLNEWAFQVYRDHPTVKEIKNAKEKGIFDLLPPQTSGWITKQDCLPNRHCDVRRHIMNAMCICWDAANASKHYHWLAKSEVVAIEPERIVTNYYQYFFTSVEPDLYIDYAGECYGLSQLKEIILQFYSGLLAHVKEEYT